MRAIHSAKEGETVTVVIDGVNKYDPLPQLTMEGLGKRADYNRQKLKEARDQGRVESAKMYEGRMNDCLDEIRKRTNV